MSAARPCFNFHGNFSLRKQLQITSASLPQYPQDVNLLDIVVYVVRDQTHSIDILRGLDYIQHISQFEPHLCLGSILA